jgi:hypothetical protein
LVVFEENAMKAPTTKTRRKRAPTPSPSRKDYATSRKVRDRVFAETWWWFVDYGAGGRYPVEKLGVAVLVENERERCWPSARRKPSADQLHSL